MNTVDDLLGQGGAVARRLDAYWQKLVDRYGAAKAAKILPREEEEEALRELGYIE